MTTATAVSPKRTTKPHQRTPAPRPWRTQHKSSGKAIRLIGVIGLLLIVAVAIGVWVDVSGSRTRTTPRTPTPTRHARWGGDGVLRSTVKAKLIFLKTANLKFPSSNVRLMS